MRLNNHIAQSIRQYPTIYRDTTYEKSRLKVLDHLFLTLGNGYEWKKGTLVEKFPEGKKVSSLLTFPDDYFTAPIMHKVAMYSSDVTLEYNANNIEAWDPYPLSEGVPLLNIPDDIKKDWLMGAKEVHDAALAFYTQSMDELIAHYLTRRGGSSRTGKDMFLFISTQLSWLSKANDRITKLMVPPPVRTKYKKMKWPKPAHT